MKIGYIRVSTEDQNLARQEVMMKEQGVEKVFMEKLSGKSTDRPQLKAMLEYVREGDTLIVESFSRLARSTRDLLDLVAKLQEKDVAFISLKESVDTSTPTGKFMLTVFAGLAELERETLLQRQAEGIAIAKAEGKYKGRRPIDKPSNYEDVMKAWSNGEITARKAMELLGVKRDTFYRWADTDYYKATKMKIQSQSHENQ